MAQFFADGTEQIIITAFIILPFLIVGVKIINKAKCGDEVKTNM